MTSGEHLGGLLVKNGRVATSAIFRRVGRTLSRTHVRVYTCKYVQVHGHAARGVRRL